MPEDLEVPIPPYLPDTAVAQRDVRQVYSNIVAMDEQVGQILEELEQGGLLESTVDLLVTPIMVGLYLGKSVSYMTPACMCR